MRHAPTHTTGGELPICPWEDYWDEEEDMIYYLNESTGESTWDMPEDFWRNDEEHLTH